MVSKPILFAPAAPPILPLPAPGVAPKEIFPAPALTVRLKAPPIVAASAKEIFPPALVNATAPVKVTARAKLMLSFEVVMSPAVLTAPAPSWVNAPSKVMSPAAAMVRRPALVMVTVPPAVVSTVLLIFTAPALTTSML